MVADVLYQQERRVVEEGERHEKGARERSGIRFRHLTDGAVFAAHAVALLSCIHSSLPSNSLSVLTHVAGHLILITRS